MGGSPETQPKGTLTNYSYPLLPPVSVALEVLKRALNKILPASAQVCTRYAYGNGDFRMYAMLISTRRSTRRKLGGIGDVGKMILAEEHKEIKR
jgi:hypothetical protein